LYIEPEADKVLEISETELAEDTALAAACNFKIESGVLTRLKT
jgi:hypothetical protein